MNSIDEMIKKKIWIAIPFFINGVLFSFIWERLGTNHTWAYYNFNFMIMGIPVVICICWGIYSLFSLFLLTNPAKKLLFSSSPLIFGLFIEPCAIRLGFWNYFFLNGEFLALLPYFISGYILITISFNTINYLEWKYLSRPKNSTQMVFVLLSCMFLFAINGLLIYSALSIIYFKKIPTWLFSRLFFD